MMKKMAAPNMEVLRFTTEDVIVTSGTGQLTQTTAVFAPPDTYFTLGRELNDAGKSANKSYFYKFTPTAKTDVFEYDKQTASKYNIQNIEDSWVYAWYNNGWQTDGYKKKYYIDNDIGWTN